MMLVETEIADAVNMPANKTLTFSIVYETENLSSVELDNIFKSLESIAEQEKPPSEANEFLIVDGGYAPEEVIQEICAKYDWITIKRIPGSGYYGGKWAGTQIVTGDVVIFLDSDCTYSRNWLKDILSVFQNRPDINIVAGETSMPIRNLYELALALNYLFPRFSHEQTPYESKSWWQNGVAFRRNFLIQNPIPVNPLFYRGVCGIHNFYLRELNGHRILKHPKCQSTHEPPEPAFILWRYLLIGRDQAISRYLKAKLRKNPDLIRDPQALNQVHFSIIQRLIGFVWAVAVAPFRVMKIKRFRGILQENSGWLWLIPLAIPLVIGFELLALVGRVTTFIQPDFLLSLYYRMGDETPDTQPQEYRVSQES